MVSHVAVPVGAVGLFLWRCIAWSWHRRLCTWARAPFAPSSTLSTSARGACTRTGARAAELADAPIDPRVLDFELVWVGDVGTDRADADAAHRAD
eukprot:6171633-Pleurochrysis_carterae.AAC.1